MGMRDEHELIEASLRGDRDAFGELVDVYQAEIRTLVAGAGVVADYVDDIAQDAFIEAYSSLGRYDREKPFGPWLRGITRNVVRRHERDRARDYRLHTDMVSRAMREYVLNTAEEPRFGREYFVKLRECNNKLSEAHRSIVQARYGRGMEPKGIAHMLGKSADNIRVTLMRIRRVLQKCIEGQMAGTETA